MKFLVVISLLLLTACHHRPKFKVGDCVAIDDHKEVWEAPGNKYIKRIIDVGVEKYHLVYETPSSIKGIDETDYILTNDDIYKKVECPSENL